MNSINFSQTLVATAFILTNPSTEAFLPSRSLLSKISDFQVKPDQRLMLPFSNKINRSVSQARLFDLVLEEKLPQRATITTLSASPQDGLDDMTDTDTDTDTEINIQHSSNNSKNDCHGYIEVTKAMVTLLLTSDYTPRDLFTLGVNAINPVIGFNKDFSYCFGSGPRWPLPVFLVANSANVHMLGSLALSKLVGLNQVSDALGTAVATTHTLASLAIILSIAWEKVMDNETRLLEELKSDVAFILNSHQC